MYAAIETYRQIARSSRVLAASPAELTTILFEDLIDLLSQATRPRMSAQPMQFRHHASRAMLVATELEAGLDFQRGGELAPQLQSVYRHVRKCVGRAMEQNDPNWCQTALDAIAPIAEAWETARSSA